MAKDDKKDRNVNPNSNNKNNGETMNHSQTKKKKRSSKKEHKHETRKKHKKEQNQLANGVDNKLERQQQQLQQDKSAHVTTGENAKQAVEHEEEKKEDAHLEPTNNSSSHQDDPTTQKKKKRKRIKKKRTRKDSTASSETASSNHSNLAAKENNHHQSPSTLLPKNNDALVPPAAKRPRSDSTNDDSKKKIATTNNSTLVAKNDREARGKDNKGKHNKSKEKDKKKGKDNTTTTTTTTTTKPASDHNDPRIVESSALDFGPEKDSQKDGTTLVLFYQYVEPIWTLEKYQRMLKDMEALGTSLQLTGRMRVAREGLNCTLTSTRERIVQFCLTLRQQPEFTTTEFKLTNDLPNAQRFPQLKVIEVIELVHYGLEGTKAPPIHDYQGVHLEPKDYHEKIAQDNTVMIDVRNHYEAIIGHFQPPKQDAWLDPLMRKSTEFPVWLDKPETKEKLKGKQVLMYCTGGIRCERATALLKYKMEHDPEIKKLGIQEVYQLQGGIDKYFKEFPDGGFWKGKNYVFDKRFAHAPPAVEGQQRRGEAKPEPMGKCEACQKPWDRFRGKRRCPTCGVPSLICKECFDKKGKKNLRDVRCDLCVAENVTNKLQLRTKEQMEIEEYEQKLFERGLIPQPEAKGERLKVTTGADLKVAPNSVSKWNKLDKKSKPHDSRPIAVANPHGVTRLFLKNMCRQSMKEETLMEFLPGISHIVWKTNGKTGEFLGQGWVEMKTPEDAAKAVAKNGQKVLGRPLYINYQPPDPKDVWPPPHSAV